MPPIDTRIQLVHLRAQGEAAATTAPTTQRITQLLHEAIRSAALEVALPGKVFVVRELDAGTIARLPTPPAAGGDSGAPAFGPTCCRGSAR